LNNRRSEGNEINREGDKPGQFGEIFPEKAFHFFSVLFISSPGSGLAPFSEQ
jgi:hypothetical protein